MSLASSSDQTRSSSSDEVPCAHCRRPVDPERAPRDGDDVFCCVGCRAVYGAIHGEGLQEFYSVRNVDAAPRPASGEEGGRLEEFDSEAFRDRYTTEHDDGTRSVELHLQGVHCAGCVWLVEKMSDRLEGVVDARLNLGRSRLTVRWRPKVVELSAVGEWLERFGYVPRPAGEGARSGDDRAEKRMLRRVGVCWAIAANVMLLAFAEYAGLSPGASGGLYAAFRWLSFGLTTGAVAYGGAVFFRRAWASIRPLLADPSSLQLDQLSIDIPISVGILAGYLHSALATVRGGGEVWFDSVAVLIAALLTARWLQVRGQMLARESADRLFRLLPMTARRISEEGTVEMVPVEEIEAGDRIEVEPSRKIPVDGRIECGSTSLRMGALTGESRPQRRENGDRVYAGSENLESTIRLEAETGAAESRVGRLRDWIQGASDASPPIVRRADRWAGAFVLAILLAAGAVWMGWTWVGSDEAMRHTVALLVIACPCALGMATPLAMTIGVGRAARRGLFVKDDAVFERLRELDILVVDKTGTVTRGEMEVVEIEGERDALRAAAVLERESRHPVGRALRRWAEESVSDEEPFEVFDGEGPGLEGRVEGRHLRVGRPDWVGEACGGLDEGFQGFAQRAAEAGRSPVAIGVDGEVRAVAALGDPVRPRAAEFVERVRGAGVELVMLSGDHPSVVESVADQIGIESRRAKGHVSPERKRDCVREMREGSGDERETRVGMLGDGVNDAAAMQAADVGIAVDGSANPSVVAADVFAARGGLEPLFDLWAGSAGVLRTVRRNVGMSIFYNVAGVAAAAGGFVSPLAAAVAMPLSSIAVVLSSVLQSPFANRSADDAFGAADPGSRAADGVSPGSTPPIRRVAES